VRSPLPVVVRGDLGPNKSSKGQQNPKTPPSRAGPGPGPRPAWSAAAAEKLTADSRQQTVQTAGQDRGQGSPQPVVGAGAGAVGGAGGASSALSTARTWCPRGASWHMYKT
jgi:hypothetical protein